jgi:uncharacterized membrane protein (UPF0136 family)
VRLWVQTHRTDTIGARLVVGYDSRSADVWFTLGMRLPPGTTVRAIAGLAVGAVACWRSWHESALGDRPLVVAMSVATSVIVAVALPSLQRRLVLPGAVPALIGVMQFAIYCCVPETDQIPQVVFAVVVLLAMELGAARPLPWWLVVPVFGLVQWSGVFGATGRSSAIVGALFAAWPLVLVLARLGSPSVAASIGSIAAIAVARTGALRPTVGSALIAVALAVAGSLVVVAADRARIRR